MTKKHIIFSISGVVLVIILFFFFKGKKNSSVFSFETEKVTQGNVVNTVTATGTIQALKTVDVGTQVSGVIRKIYVDFNSVVKKGQILAELDKTPLLASLENAKASLEDAKADINYQTSNFERVKALYDKSLVAKTDFDLAQYNFLRAKASLKNAQSNFDKATINLSYATIYSPIDGVVLNRAVDEGQTVAASFNTPTLFSIANDLTQMQVEANIDEADIGLLKMGQKVDFTVDAFSDLNFTGEVTQIRLEPVVTSNVVTYTVIVKAPNPSMKLMPGMTANISVNVQHADNVLLIPYKAIRFKPSDEDLAAYFKSLHPKKMPSYHAKQDSEIHSKTEVWIKNGDIIKPIPVVTGVSDGTSIEIKQGLKVGDEIVLSMTQETSSDKTSQGSTSSPFMPKPPKMNKR